MKRILSLMLASLLVTLAASAATYYGFKIGGVEVNSDNYQNVTGSNITSGTVKYDPSSNTVTLTDVTIERSGKDNRAILNESNSGLTVKLVGTNNLSATDAAPVRFEKSSTLIVSSGSTHITGGSEGGIYISGAYKLTINGPGTLYVQANKKGGIEGSSAANTVEFSNVTASIFGGGGCLLDIYAVTFKANSSVHLYGAVQNVKNVDLMNFEGKEVIQSPSNALFNPSTKSVAYYDFDTNSFGNNVTGGVRIDDTNVEVLINETNFPDANFRNYLTQTFGKRFLYTADVAATKLLRVNINGCINLQGIGFFTALEDLSCVGNSLQSLDVSSCSALKTLRCNDNKLGYLDLRYNKKLEFVDCCDNKINGILLPNTLTLTGLVCRNNWLTSLPALPSGLTYLDCGINNLTSLPTMPDGIQEIYAKGNKFTSLSITGKSSLETLVVSDNTLLTNLTCSGNALTTLYVDGCTAMTTLDCNNNKLTMLSELPSTLNTLNCSSNLLTSLPTTLPSELTYLNCSSNKLTSLPTLPSGIQQVYANDNKLSATLSITGKSSLKTLDVKNNTALTTLDCSNGGALTSLDVSGCTAMKNLYCSNNRLTSLPSLPSGIQQVYANDNKLSGTLTITGKSSLKTLDVSDNTLLTNLDCGGNALTTLNVSGCTAMTTLNCSNNKLTSLPSLPSTLNTLNCSSNLLTSLPTSLPTRLAYLDCGTNNLTSLPTMPDGIKEIYANDNKLSGLLMMTHRQLLRALNVKNNTSLTLLDVSFGYALTNLTVAGCQALTSLRCKSNQLSELLLTGCTALKYLEVNTNKIKGDKMTAMIESLPTKSPTEGYFHVLNTHSVGLTEDNEIDATQIAKACAKGWIPMEYNGTDWVEIANAGQAGDVDGSGIVDVDDVNAIINIILGKAPASDYAGEPDVDGSGIVDVDDVNAIINIILSK